MTSSRRAVGAWRKSACVFAGEEEQPCPGEDARACRKGQRQGMPGGAAAVEALATRGPGEGMVCVAGMHMSRLRNKRRRT